METVRGRNFEHSQMHRRILMPGEADVPNLPRLFRIHQGFERSAGGEEAVGILHPDVLVKLNQVDVIRLLSSRRSCRYCNANGTGRFPNTATGFGRDGRLNKQWRRRSSISSKAAAGWWISI